MRLFTGVVREGSTAMSPPRAPGSVPSRRASHAPSSSGPTAPSAIVRAPRADRFSTTFPAPPARRLIAASARSGTGASGATRVTSPVHVSSTIRSPTTATVTSGAAAASAASSLRVTP